MLRQVKLNIRGLVQRERGMALLFVVVQIVSVIAIFFSYGVINHFNTKTESAEGTSLSVALEVFRENGNEHLKPSVVQDVLDNIIPIIENKIEYLFTAGFCDDGVGLFMSTGYKDRRFTLSKNVEGNIQGSLKSGRVFNDKELQTGAHVALATEDISNGKDQIVLGGETYECIGVMGVYGLDNTVYVPYRALPEKSRIVYISIQLTHPLLETEYDAMVEKIRMFAGDSIVIPEFDGIRNNSTVRVYNDLIVVTVVLIFVCAINYCILYRYILEKRRRTFAISRICGATRIKSIAIYMIELLSVSLVTLAVGIVVYIKLLLPIFEKYFEYIGYYHSFNDNLTIVLAYVVTLFVTFFTLVVKFVSTSPANLLRGV